MKVLFEVKCTLVSLPPLSSFTQQLGVSSTLPFDNRSLIICSKTENFIFIGNVSYSAMFLTSLSLVQSFQDGLENQS